MNKSDFEKKLAEGIFTEKEVSFIIEDSLDSGLTYIVILRAYRTTFIVCMAMFLLMVSFWLKLYLTGATTELQSMTITMFISGAIFYFIGHMKIGFKSILFLIKYRQSL